MENLDSLPAVFENLAYDGYGKMDTGILTTGKYSGQNEAAKECGRANV